MKKLKKEAYDSKAFARMMDEITQTARQLVEKQKKEKEEET